MKVLWFPKVHYELDPSEYVAVILLNEINRQTEGAEILEVEDCSGIINRFPDDIWRIALNQVKRFEDFYEEIGPKEEIKNEESNIDKTEDKGEAELWLRPHKSYKLVQVDLSLFLILIEDNVNKDIQLLKLLFPSKQKPGQKHSEVQSALHNFATSFIEVSSFSKSEKTLRFFHISNKSFSFHLYFLT